MNQPAAKNDTKRGPSMDFLLMAAFVVIYFALQMVILPKLGVST